MVFVLVMFLVLEEFFFFSKIRVFNVIIIVVLLFDCNSFIRIVGGILK